MTTPLDRDEFNELVLSYYQDIVEKAGTAGLKRGEAADAIAADIRASVERGDITLLVDVEKMVDQVVRERDEKARRAQVDHIQIVADCINGQTILGLDDPVMDHVALVGGGLRKTWRHVGIDDVMAMIDAKTQHATDAAVAANEFQKLGHLIVGHLLRNYGQDGVIGDLTA